jgi:hypothetical protein
VRIGVRDPKGEVTMLFEKHVLSLPAIKASPVTEDAPKPLYLNKNFPLLVVSEYLSGKYSREKLVDILENIQSGRHFYFVYQVPMDAPLGRYELVSEVISGGEVRHSKTAQDDYFYIEEISLSQIRSSAHNIQATIVNHSPDPTPVKVIAYRATGQISPDDISAFELEGFEEREISLDSPYGFVSYNEEREVLPLQTGPRIIRDPYFSDLVKEGKSYLMHRDCEESFVLDGEIKKIWDFSDGLEEGKTLSGMNDGAFREMIEHKLIYPIDQTGKPISH